jgi:hypothetical protein
MKTTNILFYFLIFLYLLGFNQAVAQIGVNNGIKFDEESHDFGTFDEGKIAEHTFTFTNKTGKVVTITSVQASCGCTTPSWTKEPIVANGQGKITASYNSEGRPGAFSKSITVLLTAEGDNPESFMLTIKGTVVGVAKQTPNEVNALTVFDKDSHNFGKIQAGQKVAKTFSFKNIGTSDLSILSVYSPCNCVTHKMLTPLVVKPNETGTIELTYAPTKATTKDEVVMIFTNSTTQSQVMLTLKGEVVEIFNAQSILKESDGF